MHDNLKEKKSQLTLLDYGCPLFGKGKLLRLFICYCEFYSSSFKMPEFMFACEKIQFIVISCFCLSQFIFLLHFFVKKLSVVLRFRRAETIVDAFCGSTVMRCSVLLMMQTFGEHAL